MSRLLPVGVFCENDFSLVQIGLTKGPSSLPTKILRGLSGTDGVALSGFSR
jgi:hypothetical protein